MDPPGDLSAASKAEALPHLPGAATPAVAPIDVLRRGPSCSSFSDSCHSPTTGDGAATFVVGEYGLSSCPICLERFSLDNPAIIVRCEHGFHLQCLESWRMRSPACPVCLRPLAGDEGRVMAETDTRRRRRRRLQQPAVGVPCSPTEAEDDALGGGCPAAASRPLVVDGGATRSEGSAGDAGEPSVWELLCAWCHST